MNRHSVATRIRTLAPGIPRSRRELLASLHLLSTLRSMGWHRSTKAGAPVDAVGDPHPWLTYSAVSWLDRVLRPGVRVFEYGAGASTSWFARAGRVKEIVAVEHHPEWFARLPQPANGRIVHVPCTGTWWETDERAPYVRAVAQGAPWDVIVIDGMGRNTCARVAVDHLTPAGLVILDDTDNAASLPAQEALSGRGLGRLDFWGFKPGLGTRLCTSVFSRNFDAWLTGL